MFNYQFYREQIKLHKGFSYIIEELEGSLEASIETDSYEEYEEEEGIVDEIKEVSDNIHKILSKRKIESLFIGKYSKNIFERISEKIIKTSRKDKFIRALSYIPEDKIELTLDTLKNDEIFDLINGLEKYKSIHNGDISIDTNEKIKIQISNNIKSIVKIGINKIEEYIKQTSLDFISSIFKYDINIDENSLDNYIVEENKASNKKG